MHAHRYPDTDFSFYLVGTGLDPQFLAELGCDIELRDVAELCPEAATSRQRDRWRIFQFSSSFVVKLFTSTSLLSLRTPELLIAIIGPQSPSLPVFNPPSVLDFTQE
ncbi:MAG: hypothetical protein QNJ54_36640 [Prochloraceae cyanobacterium]|nr:hypothetical protein [Prochloraceae cyanobacterium]